MSGYSFLGGKDLAVVRLDCGMWLLWLGLTRKHHLAAEVELAADLVPAWVRVQELLVVIDIDLLHSCLLVL